MEGNQYVFRVSAENEVGIGEPAELSQSITTKSPFGEFLPRGGDGVRNAIICAHCPSIDSSFHPCWIPFSAPPNHRKFCAFTFFN